MQSECEPAGIHHYCQHVLDPPCHISSDLRMRWKSSQHAKICHIYVSCMRPSLSGAANMIYRNAERRQARRKKQAKSEARSSQKQRDGGANLVAFRHRSDGGHSTYTTTTDVRESQLKDGAGLRNRCAFFLNTLARRMCRAPGCSMHVLARTPPSGQGLAVSTAPRC
jgi:hypothetical protein